WLADGTFLLAKLGPRRSIAYGKRHVCDQQLGLQRAIASMERRLALPVGERAGHSRGYASQAERFQKQRRLQGLKARLARVEAGLGAGRVSVTRGGRELARLRHHLGPAGLSQARWRERWEAERLFITADGEADKHLGNETIRWQPEPGRWYLDASPGVPREIEDFVGWGWRLPAAPPPELKAVLSAGALGVDLNAGHLAAWVVDHDRHARRPPCT